MNDETLRTMIRQSIARHQGGARPGAAPMTVAPAPFRADPSHFRYTLPESSGPCYIEPAVACSHCGFCESHGH